ncbi:hypothetical protein VP01_510g9 [Puccinia sorghi]|uniref:Uncharacterized protein n=1 Tax=Puccinia sorghi TaxID=27349 RepID=A0A0L6ULW7_9BASI|nr:hypothetical protein VP01_510g9 [Puccinia sorghi]
MPVGETHPRATCRGIVRTPGWVAHSRVTCRRPQRLQKVKKQKYKKQKNKKKNNYVLHTGLIENNVVNIQKKPHLCVLYLACALSLANHPGIRGRTTCTRVPTLQVNRPFVISDFGNWLWRITSSVTALAGVESRPLGELILINMHSPLTFMSDRRRALRLTISAYSVSHHSSYTPVPGIKCIYLRLFSFWYICLSCLLQFIFSLYSHLQGEITDLCWIQLTRYKPDLTERTSIPAVIKMSFVAMTPIHYVCTMLSFLLAKLYFNPVNAIPAPTFPPGSTYPGGGGYAGGWRASGIFSRLDGRKRASPVGESHNAQSSPPTSVSDFHLPQSIPLPRIITLGGILAFNFRWDGKTSSRTTNILPITQGCVQASSLLFHRSCVRQSFVLISSSFLTCHSIPQCSAVSHTLVPLSSQHSEISREEGEDNSRSIKVQILRMGELSFLINPHLILVEVRREARGCHVREPEEDQT